MTDFRVPPDYYEASYPPSLWGGGTGGGTHPGGSGDITSNVASVGGVDPATLADLAALKADATIGDGNYVGAAFAGDQYVVLGDSSAATWDGSVWSAFTLPPKAANPPTGATPGTPGSFTPAGADVPADLAALKALGALGQTVAWTGSDVVPLGDGSFAQWDGTDWVNHAAPPAPAPPPGDDDVIIVPDPGGMTVDAAKAWVDALPHNGHGHDAVQEMLNLERAGLNRSTLVDWLDAKLGAI